MFHVVLVEPESPQNTGNIARTCAATDCTLHLVRPLGFELSDKYMRRAGLDYWPLVDVCIHESLAAFLEEFPAARMFFFTTKARRSYAQAQYVAGDFLVFGVIFAELILVIAQFKGQHADGIIRMVQEIAFGRESFFVQVIQGFLQDALM